MGYQVGLNCYATKQQAENEYFSKVVPVINQDGQLQQMKHTPTGWQLNGQTVQASLPECNPVDNFNDGQQIGWMVFTILLLIWATNMIKERLKL